MEPSRLQAVLDEVNAAVAAGRRDEAARVIEAAFAAGLADPALHRLRGRLRQLDGRAAEAAEDYQAALSCGPDAAVLSALGLCLAQLGDWPAAIERFSEAVALDPSAAVTRYNLALALEQAGRLAEARDAYQAALALDERLGPAWGNLAALAARAGDWAEAETSARRALALDPGQPAAEIALAGAEAEQGDAPSARQRLLGLLETSRRLAPEHRAAALGAIGDLHDRAGRSSDAFAAYEARAEVLRSSVTAQFRDGETALGLTRLLRAYFQTADRTTWRGATGPGEDERSPGQHLFLVGFARSGTTLLAQALAGHRAIAVMDERDTLTEASEAFLGEAGGLERLANLTTGEARRFRDHYWARVEASGADAGKPLLVDKMPMNTIALPLVAKLFPAAKVLVQRRDPRDVVLSCFRRQFAINPTTWEFLTLHGAARLYDAVMSLAALYGEVLPLRTQVIRYEDLVGDFEGTLRAVCGFAGVPWDAGMTRFAGRARQVVTPSAAQLARGLTGEGVGSWRRYEAQMAPVLPILAPWVAAFDYAP